MPKLMDDEKPFTTLGYYTGPGASWADGARPDLSEVDTINDKNFVQQGAMPAESDTHGGEDVAVYARGPGADKIHGVIEQNQIFDAIDRVLKPSWGTEHSRPELLP
jgi:alkaline phosphatase